MNVPLITWCCIAGLFVVILVVRLVRRASLCLNRPGRIFEIGTEREEMFIPGDRLAIDDHDLDDFDDL